MLRFNVGHRRDPVGGQTPGCCDRSRITSSDLERSSVMLQLNGIYCYDKMYVIATSMNNAYTQMLCIIMMCDASKYQYNTMAITVRIYVFARVRACMRACVRVCGHVYLRM